MIINRDYPCKNTNYTKGRSKAIKYIVIHYVGATGTALQNVKYYNSSEVEASANFYVGHKSENGAIYQSVDPANTAWHCGAKKYVHDDCRNSNSIGIEMCCHNFGADKSATSNTWYIDDITVTKAVELTKYLMEMYDIDINHVIRHYDVTGKCCPNPFVLDEDKWDKFKNNLENNSSNKPSLWAAEAAEWTTENDLIKGNEDGDCEWQEGLTREQFVVILKRYHDKYSGK
jgi:N-acetylmuramoyl-L-alanine amidase CwlA